MESFLTHFEPFLTPKRAIFDPKKGHFWPILSHFWPILSHFWSCLYTKSTHFWGKGWIWPFLSFFDLFLTYFWPIFIHFWVKRLILVYNTVHLKWVILTIFDLFLTHFDPFLTHFWPIFDPFLTFFVSLYAVILLVRIVRISALYIGLNIDPYLPKYHKYRVKCPFLYTFYLFSPIFGPFVDPLSWSILLAFTV